MGNIAVPLAKQPSTEIGAMGIFHVDTILIEAGIRVNNTGVIRATLGTFVAFHRKEILAIGVLQLMLTPVTNRFVYTNDLATDALQIVYTKYKDLVTGVVQVIHLSNDLILGNVNHLPDRVGFRGDSRGHSNRPPTPSTHTKHTNIPISLNFNFHRIFLINRTNFRILYLSYFNV